MEVERQRTTEKPAEKAAQEKLLTSALTFVDKLRSEIAKMLAGQTNLERFVQCCKNVVKRNDKLLLCTGQSLRDAIMTAAQLGLEPAIGSHARIHFIPFGNEVQVIIDYKGLCDIAHRGDKVLSFYPDVVYEKDRFSYRRGTDPYLEHVPASGDRGKPIAAYAVIKLINGGVDFEVMYEDEINKSARSRSKTANRADSPWQTDTLAMWKKTPIRRLFKRLPYSLLPPEAHEALAREDELEYDFGASPEANMKMPSEKPKTQNPAPTSAPPQAPPKSATKPTPKANGGGTTQDRDALITECLKMYGEMNWDGWKQNAFATLVIGHYGKLTTFSVEHLAQLKAELTALQTGEKSVRFTSEKKPKGGYACAWVSEGNTNAPTQTNGNGGNGKVLETQKRAIGILLGRLGLDSPEQAAAITAQYGDGETDLDKLTQKQRGNMVMALTAVQNGKGELTFDESGAPSIQLGK